MAALLVIGGILRCELRRIPEPHFCPTEVLSVLLSAFNFKTQCFTVCSSIKTLFYDKQFCFLFFDVHESYEPCVKMGHEYVLGDNHFL